MTKISVPDMMCENCVRRITNALDAAELKFQVSLEDKTSVRSDAGGHWVQQARASFPSVFFLLLFPCRIPDFYGPVPSLFV